MKGQRGRRTLVLASTPWSGTRRFTSVTTSGAACPEPVAWFDPNRLSHYARTFGISEGAADWAGNYLKSVSEKGAEQARSGLLLMWPHQRALSYLLRAADQGASDDSSGEAELFERWFPKPHFVFLRSEDQGLQAVRWYVHLHREALRTDQIDFQEVAWLETLIANQSRAWGSYFQMHGVVPREVTYESLVARPAETVKAALAGWSPPLRRAGAETDVVEDEVELKAEELTGAYRRRRSHLSRSIGVRAKNALPVSLPAADLEAEDQNPLNVIVSVRPYRGHLHPMIPLARAFAKGGHRVMVATSEDGAAVVLQAGLSWLPAGLNPRQTPELSERSDPDYGWLTVRTKVDDLLAASMGGFRPDVIVRDPTDLAPTVVSELVGSLNVTYGLSRFIPRESWEILGADRTVARLRRDFKLPPDPELDSMFNGLYLAVVPPLLEPRRPLPVESVQRLSYRSWDSGRTSRPRRDRSSRERPKVLVTLGTVYNGDTELFGRFIEALGGEDVDVICALGEGGDEGLTEGAPSNIRFERYIPFSEVLPDCDVLLCHGGFNTVMGALMAGVPTVCVPLGSDQDFNARMCQKRGLGLEIDEEKATPEVLRAAVRRIIEDATFEENVAEFRAQMEAAPGPVKAVTRIQRMIADRRLQEHSG